MTCKHSPIALICLILAAHSACGIMDDDQPPPPGTTTSEIPETCQEELDAIPGQCLPGMNIYATVHDGDSNIVLIDDPAATVGVGPGAWLVQAATESDFIASYSTQGGECSAGCGWCNPGESLCHQGLDDNGAVVGCWMCLPFGTPDMGSQCAEFAAACMDNSDDGLDETGAGYGSYDCSQWDLTDAVSKDPNNIFVDRWIVEELTDHAGAPLVDCDQTRFRQQEEGYFVLSHTTPGSLFSRMGLQPNDVILTIDSEPMNGADVILSAMMGLVDSQDGFAFTFQRGQNTIATNVRFR